MHEFRNIKSVEELLRSAELEILPAGISVESEGATVIPVNCPAKGRKDDYGKDEKGGPACVFRGTNCPYFSSASFMLNDFSKKIICNLTGE